MSKIEFCPLPRDAFDQILDRLAVFRMSSLHNGFKSHFGLRLEFKYPIGLVRPINFSARHVPSEASRVAEELSFRKVRLPALEFAIKLLEFYHHLIEDRPQASDFVTSGSEHTMSEVAPCQSRGTFD